MTEFHLAGCLLPDHALDIVMYKEATFEEVSAVYDKVLRGHSVSPIKEAQYKTYTLQRLALNCTEGHDFERFLPVTVHNEISSDVIC